MKTVTMSMRIDPSIEFQLEDKASSLGISLTTLMINAALDYPVEQTNVKRSIYQ